MQELALTDLPGLTMNVKPSEAEHVPQKIQGVLMIHLDVICIGIV